MRCLCNLLQGRPMRYPSLSLCAVLLCAWASAAQAQVRLEGVVRDTAGEPVAGARVEVFDNLTRERVRAIETDRQGRFAVRLRDDSGYRVHIALLGYLSSDTSFVLSPGRRTVPVEFRLIDQPVGLMAIDVTARARSPAVLNGFNARQRAGVGHFLTRADLERIRPAMVTDALVRIPGVQLESSGGSGLHRRIRMARAGTRNCPVQVFVDGFLMNPLRGRDPGRSVDDMVSVSEVEGIEVYKGLSSVPAEFLNENARCGVVVIWTRRGG
jgi:Carboxypeptidase regulatory-like domain/TonB-dependent Receptor Plug Domain